MIVNDQKPAMSGNEHRYVLTLDCPDRVGIVAHGRMVAEGGVEELRSRGPVRYRVGTSARGWYPAGTAVVQEDAESVVLEVTGVEAGFDQDILRAAMAAGDVHEFTRVVPDLTDLFKEAVQ